MSRGFWQAIALICASFAVYETAINWLLSDVNDRLRDSVAVMGTCVPETKQPSRYIQAEL